MKHTQLGKERQDTHSQIIEIFKRPIKDNAK